MPKKLEMPEFVMTTFGTKDVEAIIQKKSEGPQTRAVPASKPVKVPMTPEECRKLCTAAGVEYYPGYEARVLQYTMSDETVDRYGDIVVANGCDMANYKKNAVIMTFHDYKQFPVGCCLKVWVDKEEKKVKGWVLIVDDQVDPTGISDTAFRFASSGYMKAGSIGFMPKKTYRPTPEEKEKLGMGEWGLMFKEWELMEFSLCGVPANPNAVQESVARGMFLQKDVDLLKREFPDNEFKDFIASVEALIAKEKEAVASTENTVTPLEEQRSKAPDETAAPSPVITLTLEDLTKLVSESVKKEIAGLNLPQKDAPKPVEKVGAVLSKKNKDLVTAAITQMSEAVVALQALLAAADKNSESASNEDETTTPAEEDKEAEGPDLYEMPEAENILADLGKAFNLNPQPQ